MEEEETGRQFSVFLIQNIGLLVGYGIMLFLAYFGGQIDFGNWFIVETEETTPAMKGIWLLNEVENFSLHTS